MTNKKPLATKKKNLKDELVKAELTGEAPAYQVRDKDAKWALTLKHLARLGLLDEGLNGAIRGHGRSPLSGTPVKEARASAFNLCGFYAQACIDGQDLKKELDVCCTIAASLYKTNG